jgi:hypothetical protein
MFSASFYYSAHIIILVYQSVWHSCSLYWALKNRGVTISRGSFAVPFREREIKSGLNGREPPSLDAETFPWS